MNAIVIASAAAPIEFFEEIDSTNAEARRRAEGGDFGPTWLLARSQSAGRGRRGRAWVSFEGNLLATLLAPSARAPAQLALMGFAAALALADTIETYLPVMGVRLKWPNDALIDGAKAAGVLLDSGAGWMALGAGVNLAAAPALGDQNTTSLAAATGAPGPAPREFLAAFATRLDAWDAHLVREGFAPLREAWLARAYGLGEQVRVAIGEAVLEGRLAGLSARGELELETPAGLRLIAAGDVLPSSPEAALP